MIPKWSDPESITEETFRGSVVEIAESLLKHLGCGYRRFKRRVAPYQCLHSMFIALRRVRVTL